MKQSAIIFVLLSFAFSQMALAQDSTYWYKLKSMGVKNLRTTYVNDGFVHAIAKNKCLVLHPDGKIVYIKDDGKWDRRREEVEDPFNIRDLVPASTMQYMIRKEDHHYTIRDTKDYSKDYEYVPYPIVISDVSIDTLYFLNKRVSWYRQAGRMSEELFICQKDGKYGLATIDYKNTAYDSFRLEHVLPMVFDNIESYAELDDVFTFNVDTDKRLYLERDGLLGLYPIQRDVCYTKLKIYSAFARFILPNGKKGWLNTFTGEEFLDL